MDESRFYFTFSFDYCSSPFRKNPFGVIEAFLNAFPTGQDNVGLVVKSMGAPELYPNLRAAIRDATNGDPRIMLIDEELPREQVLGFGLATPMCRCIGLRASDLAWSRR